MSTVTATSTVDQLAALNIEGLDCDKLAESIDAQVIGLIERGKIADGDDIIPAKCVSDAVAAVAAKATETTDTDTLGTIAGVEVNESFLRQTAKPVDPFLAQLARQLKIVAPELQDKRDRKKAKVRVENWILKNSLNVMHVLQSATFADNDDTKFPTKVMFNKVHEKLWRPEFSEIIDTSPDAKSEEYQFAKFVFDFLKKSLVDGNMAKITTTSKADKEDKREAAWRTICELSKIGRGLTREAKAKGSDSDALMAAFDKLIQYAG